MNMSALKNSNNKNHKNFILGIMWFLLAFSKFFQFTFLSEKYFYDSNLILYGSLYSTATFEKTYTFTSNFFRTINVFHFDTLKEWSISLTIVFSFVIYGIINKRIKHVDFMQFIFLGCSIFLLGVYVFNISKEIIQLLIFLAAYEVILTNKIKKPITKVIFCSIIFLAESIIFRAYYILVSMFIFYLYFGVRKFFLTKSKITINHIIKVCMLTLFIVFAFLAIVRVIMPEQYNSVITARSNVNINRVNTDTAQTIIIDMIPAGNSLFLWMLNYLINAIRLMIPLELVIKGIQYWPFAIYQMLITYYLIKLLKNLKKTQDDITILSTCVFCAYLLVSYMFEPDFGSWVRHETAAFPILINLIMAQNNVTQIESV